MKLPERIIYIFTVFSVIFSFSLLSTVFSHNASASDTAGFMDLERSIKELKQIVKKTTPGVVTVVAYDDSGAESGRGSGFFIDTQGRIITNSSVLKDAYSAEVFSKSNYYDDVIILNRDEGLDFALIQVKAAGEVYLEPDFGYKIEPGERVVVIGRSADLGKTVSEGLVSSLSNIEERAELIKIQTTTPILSYRAGKDGPLLNMAGKVIGVTGTGFPESEGFEPLPWPDNQEIKAVSLRSIKSLLSGQGEFEHLQRAKSGIWSQWFIRSIKTAAITGFITLYDIGFPKLMAIVFVIIVIISIIQWLYLKLKKLIFNR
ncbi:MAG TPA: serine protease [Nitrospirae bacterium]|nr:putative serine protease HhoB precursor [bacterium BMS3Abin06]HDH12949.1 serine protease [Nitrospirota bacterium]HDZ00437.1 serine protease [Nitrospirota bacterium]